MKWDGQERRINSQIKNENLATFIQGEFKAFDATLQSIIERQNEHHQELYGKDSNTPGIKVKVDRLEQSKKLSDLLSTGALVSFLGLISKAIWDLFTGHK